VEALPDLPTVFNAFSARRNSSGEIDLLELSFPVVANNGQRTLGEPQITPHFEGVIPPSDFLYPIGRPDCLPNNPGSFVNPNHQDDEILKGVDELFNKARSASDSCRDEIGGPIDVAALGPDGFRWLRRKPIQL